MRSKRRPEVDEVERVATLLQIVARQAALQHAERELLVVAAEAGVQAIAVLHDRRLDLVEAVRAIDLADDAEHALAPRLLGGEEVAHAAGRVHRTGHGAILTDRADRAGTTTPKRR